MLVPDKQSGLSGARAVLLAENAVVVAWRRAHWASPPFVHCSVAALGMEGGKKKRSETNEPERSLDEERQRI